MHKRLHCSCHHIQSYRFSFSANNWVQMAHTVAAVILHYVLYEKLDCLFRTGGNKCSNFLFIEKGL